MTRTETDRAAITPSVLLLNPNSSVAVTNAIVAVVETFGDIPVDIRVDQIDEGPETIESAEDHEKVLPLILRRIEIASEDVVIVACHGDPGVKQARVPGGPRILGIGESSMLVACAAGGNFGVITLSNGLVTRKLRQVEQYGLSDRCAGVVASGTGVLHGLREDPDIQPYVEAGRELARLGATSIILGCAGMVRVQSAVQSELNCMVIDPVKAAIGLVLGIPVYGRR